MDNDKRNKMIPIIIIFFLVAFIVAGSIICINSFNKNKESDTNQNNQVEEQLPILNGTIIPKKGTEINLR